MKYLQIYKKTVFQFYRKFFGELQSKTFNISEKNCQNL